MLADFIDAVTDWVFWLEVVAYFAAIGLFTAFVVIVAGYWTGILI